MEIYEPSGGAEPPKHRPPKMALRTSVNKSVKDRSRRGDAAETCVCVDSILRAFECVTGELCAKVSRCVQPEIIRT